MGMCVILLLAIDNSTKKSNAVPFMWKRLKVERLPHLSSQKNILQSDGEIRRNPEAGDGIRRFSTSTQAPLTGLQ